MSVTGLLTDLGLQPLQERRLIARLAIFHRTVNKTIAVDIPPYITPNHRQLRHAHDQQFTNIRARTDLYKFSYFPRTIRAWNTLPAEIVLQPKTDTFKSHMQRRFKDNTFRLSSPKDAHTHAVSSNYTRHRLKSTTGDSPLVLC